MATSKRLIMPVRAAPPLTARITKLWSHAGIRTRILVPLLFLMLLSVLGSTVSFILSTNTTRNQLLDDQLADDVQRVSAALAASEQSLVESAQLLAGDARLAPLLANEGAAPGGDTLLDLDRRALNVLVRYRLDQVLIVNAAGKPRANIVAQSALSQLGDEARRELLAQAREGRAVLLRAEDGKGWLLLVRASVADAGQPGAVVGTVYTVLNVAEELSRIRRDLQLSADVQLAAAGAPVASTLAPAPQLAPHAMELVIDSSRYRAAWQSLPVGERQVDLAVLRSEATINATVSSGLRAMLLSSGITLVLLALGGVLVSRSITRPILRLSRVAQQVAAGDLASKAGLRQHDEIGQLGRTLDHATDTIKLLLDQQARTTGERQAILNSIADGVLAVDSEQRIVLINPAAAALLGVEANATQRPLIELARSPDATIGAGAQLIIELIRASLGGEEDAGEGRVALGSQVVRVRSAPVLSGERRIGAVVVLQDVTRAVEADRAKSEFIAVASHELRTPLTGLKGFVDLMLIDGTAHMTPMQQASADAIYRQTNNLVLLANDLLEMARLEGGGARADRRWVSLGLVVGDVLAGLRAQATHKYLQLEHSIPADLPPLWIDERHLHRILSNLLSNAVKYTPNGGRVSVRAFAADETAPLPAALAKEPWPHPEADSLLVVVEDTGVGIRREDQGRIFSRFFSSENALSVEAGGTGLGLAITQALVTLHGGQIAFESAEGRGSCFWVRLPLAVGAALPVALGEV